MKFKVGIMRRLFVRGVVEVESDSPEQARAQVQAQIENDQLTGTDVIFWEDEPHFEIGSLTTTEDVCPAHMPKDLRGQLKFLPEGTVITVDQDGQLAMHIGYVDERGQFFTGWDIPEADVRAALAKEMAQFPEWDSRWDWPARYLKFLLLDNRPLPEELDGP
jgi:hypothetical protein